MPEIIKLIRGAVKRHGGEVLHEELARYPGSPHLTLKDKVAAVEKLYLHHLKNAEKDGAGELAAHIKRSLSDLHANPPDHIGRLRGKGAWDTPSPAYSMFVKLKPKAAKDIAAGIRNELARLNLPFESLAVKKLPTKLLAKHDVDVGYNKVRDKRNILGSYAARKIKELREGTKAYRVIYFFRPENLKEVSKFADDENEAG